MRKLFIIVAIVFIFFGIVLVILPTEKLALIPIGLSILLGVLAYKKSDVTQVKLPRVILIIAGLTLVVSIAKMTFMKDEVAVDQKFEQKKVESAKEDKKDLEGLE